MYRFPEDLDLSHLVGGELIQVCIDRYNLLLNFDPVNRINLCGVWRLRDSEGEVVDEGDSEMPKDTYRAHLLLGHQVRQWRIPNPRLLTIVFDNRWTLDIHDDDDRYECCHISPNIYI
jgi:hypothetical protein